VPPAIAVATVVIAANRCRCVGFVVVVIAVVVFVVVFVVVNELLSPPPPFVVVVIAAVVFVVVFVIVNKLLSPPPLCLRRTNELEKKHRCDKGMAKMTK
jgi:hypothetical protein